MDRKPVEDFSERGPLTQSGIRACRDFEVRDGQASMLGFHDHPNEMWVDRDFEALATRCEAAGWLKIRGMLPNISFDTDTTRLRTLRVLASVAPVDSDVRHQGRR